MRLECQSSGGKPAPRIEWLNLTRVQEAPLNNSRADRHELQLMRLHWPTKRASFQQPAANGSAGGEQVPVTSSSVTVTVGRADARARFVCLLLPAGTAQPPPSAGPAQWLAELAPEWRHPDGLAQLLEQTPMLGGPRGDRKSVV